MTPSRTGSLRLFRFAGISVYVHWSWLVVAVFEIRSRTGSFRSLAWNVIEYLTLFGVVLLHEFGHALACRQVDGQADEIVLWPLGGVAYVTPPARPAPTLWSIAAGPLVNLVLLAPTAVLLALLPAGDGDGLVFLRTFALMNAGLLVFNLLPIYPLDGGQMLRALLWFVLGRAQSLKVAAAVGLVAVLGLLGLAAAWGSLWLGILGLFALLSCWRGLGRARVLARLAQLPQHQAFACPACKSAPPMATLWPCSLCGAVFDPFATGGSCPQCGTALATVPCPDCGRANPMARWATTAARASAPPIIRT